MAETSIGALAVRIGGDASGLISELGKSKTALGKFGDTAKQAAKSAAQITGAIAAAGAAIFVFARKVAATGDQFEKMSLKVGASIEFLSAFAHSVRLGGATTEGMEKSIGRLARTMSDASNGLATAKRGFDDLDVNVQNADGSLRAVPEVVLEIADRMAGMTDETKMAALAQELFGRSGLEMLPVLKHGSAAIREQMEEARRLGIVWTDEAARDAVVFNDNVERLSGAVEGLSMKLAGPLIKALGDASGAMLEAQKQSQGFFATLAAGFQSILTGDDTTKWQREFVNATDTLLKAQNDVDRARHVIASGAGSGISASIDVLEKRLADAQGEVNRLLGIKPILAPETAPAAGGGGPTGGTPGLNDRDAAKREALLDKQAEAEAQRLVERIQRQGEVYAEELGMLEAFEEEKESRARAHAERMEEIALEDAMRQGEIAEGAAERDAAVREAMYEIARGQREREKQANQDFWNNLSGLMNTGSKKVFEIGKAASLAQAAIKGASAVMSAWEAGMSVGGPWAPLVAAAYAAAAGINALNLMNNIRSQQFGGGGGAPVHPTQGASGVSPVGAGGGQAQRDRPVMHTTVVLPAADLTSTSAVRQLLLGMTEEIEANGGRLSIQG